MTLARYNLGDVAKERGKLQEARSHYCEALRTSIETDSLRLALATLAQIAGILKEEGEKGYALEIFYTVARHPAAAPEIQATAEHAANELESELPAHAVEAARARELEHA